MLIQISAHGGSRRQVWPCLRMEELVTCLHMGWVYVWVGNLSTSVGVMVVDTGSPKGVGWLTDEWVVW